MRTSHLWPGNAWRNWPTRPSRHMFELCIMLVLALLATPATAQILPQGHRFYGQTVGSALAREVAVGAGEVWIIGNEPTGQGNYNVMHLVGNQFERVTGQAVKIAVDGAGVPWVITAQNTIWRFDPSRKRGWDRMPGLATEIAAAGNEVWAIGVEANELDREVARWNGSRWVGVAGRGAKISVTANGTAYVVNSRGILYRRTPNSTTGFDRLADGVNQVNATVFLPGSPVADEIVVVTTTTGKVLTMAGDAWYGSNGDSAEGLAQGPGLALRVARDPALSLRVYAILGGAANGAAGPVIVGEPNEDATYAAPVVAQATPAPATLGYFIPVQALSAEAALSNIYSTYQPPAWMTKVSRNWMSWLPDSTPLHKLSLPGTHDSGARFGAEDVVNRVTITQIWKIAEQLKAGVRFFDMRTRAMKNGLIIYHGPISQLLSMDDVLKAVDRFLSENPGEVVVMMMASANQPDQPGADNSSVQWARLKARYAHLFGVHPAIPPKPTLGELRGKVLFLYNNNYGDPNGVSFTLEGWKFKENPIWYLQNAYNVYPALASDGYDEQGNVLTTDLQGKLDLVVETLNVAAQPGNDKWVLNMLAGSGGMFPSTVAEAINENVYSALSGSQVPRTISLGTVIMDFPGESLLTRIISSNFRFD